MQNLQVTEAIKNNQAVGKALAEKFKKEVLVIKSFNEEITLDDIKQLYTKLSKLEKSYEPLKRTFDNAPTDATLEYLANGGSAMLAYCRMQLKKEGILKSYSAEITQDELNVEQQLPKLEIQVNKAYNEEKRLATFLVLEPQDDDGTTNDLHEHWYDADTVEKACYDFNRYCMKANLLHLMPTSAYSFLESYITKADMVLGDRYIKKGTWIATIHVDESELGQQIWDGIKSGYFNGLSIQCMGVLEDIED